MTLTVNKKTYEAGELVAYVEKLEKENAELKEHHKIVCENLTNTHRNIRKQLTKAKEIIKGLLELGSIGDGDYIYVAEAEQFLKEK